MIKNIIIWLLFILANSVFALEESKVINIGGKYITVSSPYGFHIETDKEILRMLKNLLPKDQISLEVAISPNIESEKYRAIMISTIPTLKNNNISNKSFKYFSKTLIEQQYTLLNEYKHKVNEFTDYAVKSLNNEFNNNTRVSLDELTALGVFINNDNAVSMAVVVNGQFASDNYSDNTPQISTVSYLKIKNRLLLVHLFSDYIDNQDILWAKSKTKEIVGLLLKVNN